VAAGASSFGVSVVLIEKGKMGGDCLNYGCVPSKALIAAGKQAHALRHGAKFGISDVEPQVDFKRVHAHIHEVIAKIAPMDSVERFTALGVKVIQAEAKFKDADTVLAGDYEIRARRYVIATGSSAAVPPIKGLSEVPFLTNESIFDLTKRPGHLVVIGGGPIGIELAQAHHRLGSKVSVIEAQKALAKDDPELTAIALAKIRAEGIVILEETPVLSAEPRGKTGIRVNIGTASGPQQIDGTHILVAAGRAANVGGMDLEKAGIDYDKRGVKVSAKLRTSNRRVYAIGDVAGGLQFTHVAGYHAGVVLRSILFRLPAKQSTGHIPWATFTDPEIAHVGMTEADARKLNQPLHILRWPYSENDRASAERKTEGLIKIVTDKKGRILGASIVGAGASEMISIYALAISKKLRASDLASFVAPYPTMSEIGKRAATSYYAPLARKPLIRRVISFLRRFG
jgi:pyruvate/2-oxoglutarate dehydrogenase complex dihydrolipoamide dehydrogenase (E3) component